MAKGTIMRSLKINEISGVDRPAQKGARATIMKRDGGKSDAYWDRDFSADQLAKAVKSGAAMADGTFPIEARDDVRKAVGSLDQATAATVSAVRVHIVKRATDLDSLSLVPEDWKAAKGAYLLKSATRRRDMLAGIANKFDVTELAVILKAGDAFKSDEIVTELRKLDAAKQFDVSDSFAALWQGAYDVMDDESVVDKSDPLKELAKQFTTHIQGLVPAGFQKAIGSLVPAENDGGNMFSKAFLKSLGLKEDADEAAVLKAIEKRDAEFAHLTNVVKMSADHKAFMDKLPADKQQAFAAQSADERNAQCAKVDKDDPVLKLDDGTEIRKSAVGPEVFKALEQSAKNAKAASDALAKSEEARLTSDFSKRAEVLKNIGSAADVGGVLLAVAKFDSKVADQVEALLKTANEKIAAGNLLKEHGSSQRGETDASKAIDKAAHELLAKEPALFKNAKLDKMSVARAEIRKRDPELAKREDAEKNEQKRAA